MNRVLGYYFVFVSSLYFIIFLYFKGRAYFNLHHRPAFLQIDPIRLTDAGDYRCRVDFKRARTVNTIISLKVIGKIKPKSKSTCAHIRLQLIESFFAL